MAQVYGLTTAIVTFDFLFTHATFCCFAATFNRNHEFAIPSMFSGNNINLRNIQGKTDLGWGRYGHRFYSVCENDFHSTSLPHMGVPPKFLKNQKTLLNRNCQAQLDQFSLVKLVQSPESVSRYIEF